ncbi:MAG: hypothetical protein ABSB22_11650 [Thermodesulfobacteriota bacterium]
MKKGKKDWGALYEDVVIHRVIGRKLTLSTTHREGLISARGPGSNVTGFSITRREAGS